MGTQLPRDRGPFSNRNSVPRFSMKAIDKKSQARTDGEKSYGLETGQHLMPSNSNNRQFDTELWQYRDTAIARWQLRMWQLRQRTRKQIFPNKLIRSALHNIPMRRAIRFM